MWKTRQVSIHFLLKGLSLHCVVASSYIVLKKVYGFNIWSFNGKHLYRILKDSLYQFLWRPRPASFLTAEKEEEIAKNLKRYSKKYEAEDQQLQQAESPKNMLAEFEWKDYLAFDASESDDNSEIDDQLDEKARKQDMYHSLVYSGNGSDEDAEHDIGQEMEVTFHSGLECLNKKLMEKKNKRSETVLEASLRQRREKKKANKNKLKCLSDDDSDQQAIGADEFFIEEPLCLEEEEGTKSAANAWHQLAHKHKKGQMEFSVPREMKMSFEDSGNGNMMQKDNKDKDELSFLVKSVKMKSKQILDGKDKERWKITI
ncbi:unnamed protein product [Trifolium pratense]|uniref:Uncharacterized protein n=1 Tax=Trifolium pratense TaxID=57577 RepID=A0ACB0JJB7_TRIPR|nr:unnamed protein product [Trifolium pratense]